MNIPPLAWYIRVTIRMHSSCIRVQALGCVSALPGAAFVPAQRRNCNHSTPTAANVSRTFQSCPPRPDQALGKGQIPAKRSWGILGALLRRGVVAHFELVLPDPAKNIRNEPLALVPDRVSLDVGS